MAGHETPRLPDGTALAPILGDGPLTRLLGTRYPLVLGPFGGGPSTVALTAAVSNAGGLGSFGASIVAPEELLALVAQVRERTRAPFAMNLWVPQPSEAAQRPSREDFEAHLARLRPFLAEVAAPEPRFAERFGQDFDAQVEALLDARPPVMSFVMGVPDAAILAAARQRGITTIATATTVEEALALDAAGVDAIVASGSDAGGHRGAFLRPVSESLVGTFSLVPQVVDAVSRPVIAAGGIADGRGVAAALALGAHGVLVGTAFLATEESGASAAHKAALHGPGALVTVLTRAFSGRTARGIANRFIREMAPVEDDVPAYPVQNALTAPMRKAASERGEGDLLNLWAGQAAPLTRPRTAAACVTELLAEATQALAGLGAARLPPDPQSAV